MSLLSCIKSDFYKLKHTKIGLIHILVPLLTAGAFLAYYEASPWSDWNKVSTYLEFLGFAFPFIIGLMSAKIVEQEKEAGNFFQMLCSTKTRVYTYVSKLVILFTLEVLSISLAIMPFAFRFPKLTKMFYLQVLVIYFVSNLFLYMEHLLLSLKFGMGNSIGAGIIESLIAALALTGLGDNIWFYLPCTWSARLCSYLTYMEQHKNAYLLGMHQMEKCFIIGSIYTIGLAVCGIVWFCNWQGRHSVD